MMFAKTARSEVSESDQSSGCNAIPFTLRPSLRASLLRFQFALRWLATRRITNAAQKMCKCCTMQLILTTTLAISLGKTPTKTTAKKKKTPVSSTPHLQPHPHRLDLKENQLSAEILSMQRRIRKSERQTAELEKQPGDHAPASQPTSKHKAADVGIRMSRKDHWERLNLEEVQSCDLEAMDLTGLSPSLLAHPAGATVDYTERERTMAKALLEKDASEKRET